MIPSEGFYCDLRHGVVPRWYTYVPKDTYMRVSDEIKHSVCYLCVHHGGRDYTPYATAFFLSSQFLSNNNNRHYYLVTARHCIDGLSDAHRKRGIHIRFNNNEGKAEYAALSDEWEFPDGTADVAVLPLDALPDSVEVDSVDLSYCVTDEERERRVQSADHADTNFAVPAPVMYVGLGDEILITGLFLPRKGRHRNIPIVRSGIIAAVPEELIYDETANEWFRAYLMELRSIGGLSGSPVFVSVSRERAEYAKSHMVTYPETASRVLFLCGLVRSHWSLLDEDDESSILRPPKQTRKKAPKASSANVDKLNTGIAAVTPFSEVIYILRKDKLEKRRKEKEIAHLTEQGMLTPDSGIGDALSQKESELTPEGFQDALKRASRKTSEPKSEKK